jgi:hypothetical protein
MPSLKDVIDFCKAYRPADMKTGATDMWLDSLKDTLDASAPFSINGSYANITISLQAKKVYMVCAGLREIDHLVPMMAFAIKLQDYMNSD